ncbi:LysE family translocator [Noviherbaspirillum sp.]|uniref:LysE family translocator n=1 Tax=Noviherbaspirillum sp. TaxID=1926288 RepID=UPI002D3C85A8|nr:LysE family translocator [Noviherbaspirillum sp.]HZW21306.1 LysE family translocator [Noviherbaspirillum sp.]
MLWSFVIATCVVTLMPGPSMVAVVMNSIQRSLAQGVQTALGVVAADAILLALTLSGIGTLLYTSSLAFSVLKWGGVAYLVYCGIRQLRSKVDEADSQAQAKGNAFLQGFGITMLNPKIIGFLVAFFPQFLSREESIVRQLTVLGPVFLAVVFATLLFYALTASAVRGVLQTRRGRVVLKNVSGGALVGCGVLAAGMSNS